MLKYHLLLITILCLALACSSSGGGDQLNDTATAIPDSGEVSGKVSGDKFSQIRVIMEDSNGNLTETSTNSAGEYTFPASAFKLSETYKISPRASYIDYLNDQNQSFSSIVYLNKGLKNIDFSGRYNYPDRVVIRGTLLRGTPLDMSTRPDGVGIYISTGKIDENSEDPNALENDHRSFAIASFDVQQRGESAALFTKTGSYGAIQLLSNHSATRMYALNRNSVAGGNTTVVSYELNRSYGLGKSVTHVLGTGFQPSAMTISADDSTLYVCSETKSWANQADQFGQIVSIDLNNDSMIDTARFHVPRPISMVASDNILFVLSSTADFNTSGNSVIHRYRLPPNENSLLEPKVIDNQKVTKLFMSRDKKTFYTISVKPDGSLGGKISSYRVETGAFAGQYPSEGSPVLNSTPTDMFITSNDKEIYVTFDNGTSTGELHNLERSNLSKNSVLFVGKQPNSVVVPALIAPTETLGFVTNRADTTFSVLRN